MLGPQHLLPGDLVEVLDHGPPDKLFPAPVHYRWHATDAKHAVSLEPERYKLVEHAVSVDPHQPGYYAVTKQMLAHGFNAPLREARAAADQPEPEPQPSPTPGELIDPAKADEIEIVEDIHEGGY